MKKFLFILMGGLIALCLLLVVSYLFFPQSIQGLPFSRQSIPNDWKTYRNEIYRFEFRYPSTWTYKEEFKPSYDPAAEYRLTLEDDGFGILIDTGEKFIDEITVSLSKTPYLEVTTGKEYQDFVQSGDGTLKKVSFAGIEGIQALLKDRSDEILYYLNLEPDTLGVSYILEDLKDLRTLEPNERGRAGDEDTLNLLLNSIKKIK